MTYAAPPSDERSAPPARSFVLSLVAWALLLASALLLPISFIATLMIVAGSYGTSSVSLLGALTVIAGPPFVFVAAVAILRRKTWGLVSSWFALAVVLVDQLHGLLRSLFVGTTTHVSPGGVPTTALASGPGLFLPLVAISGGLLAFLTSRRVRSEFVFGKIVLPVRTPHAPPLPVAATKEPRRGWRVGHRGRDQMYYEERNDGTWQRIDIDGEMLCGPAHHVIYFASPERWQGYPEWARHRRDEIIARVKSEFREPDYEYHGA